MERWGGSGAGSIVAFIATRVDSRILRFPITYWPRAAHDCVRYNCYIVSHNHMGRAVWSHLTDAE